MADDARLADRTPSDLAALLIAAHRDDAMVVPAKLFANLSRETAMEVQCLVRSELAALSVPAAKVGLATDSTSLSAPIFDHQFQASGSSPALPRRGIAGIEIEIAVRLAVDLGPHLADADDTVLMDTIDEFCLVLEMISSRFDDRRAAGLWGPLADNMVTGGLVYAKHPLPRHAVVDGWPLRVKIDGHTVWDGVSKHPFGSILTPLRAAASASASAFSIPLKRGMLVTTGSLADRLLPVAETSKIHAQLGDVDIRWQPSSARQKLSSELSIANAS